MSGNSRVFQFSVYADGRKEGVFLMENRSKAVYQSYKKFRGN